MAYIGPEPNPGQNREVDDISSSFNGSTTAFTLQVNSQNVSPGSSNNIIVSLGGVVQNPGTDYNIAASTITFTTAPASGLSFFGLVLGQQVDIQSLADGTSPTMSAPSITGDLSIADKIVHTGDTNNAIRFPAADTITAETGGSERVRVDSSGNVGIGKTSPNIGSHTRVLTVSNTGTSARTGIEIEGNTANAHGVLEFYSNGTLVSGLNSRGSDRLQFVTGSGGTVRGQFTSNGLNFGSDTAAANALDDYEEGTYTPTVTFESSDGGNKAYAQQGGSYTKIGRLVRVNFHIELTNKGTGSGNTEISLPFTPANLMTATALEAGGLLYYFTGLSSSVSFISLAALDGVARCRLYGVTGTQDTSMNGITYSFVANTFNIRGSVTFLTAS